MKRLLYYDLSTEVFSPDELSRLATALKRPLGKPQKSGYQELKEFNPVTWSSPEHEQLLESFQALGLPNLEPHDISERWEQSELYNARYAVMIADSLGGYYDLESWGTLLDYSKECSRCGSDVQVASPLLKVDKKLIGKRDIVAIGDELVVSERLRQACLENGIIGTEFLPVEDYKGRDGKFPPLYCMNVSLTAPPLSSPENPRCTVCGNPSFSYFADLAYSAKNAETLNDINRSAELMRGNRYYVVSQKFYRLFHKLKAKQVELWIGINIQL